MSAVRGRWPLMLRTGWLVVRRTTRVSPSSSSIARVVSETCTVTVWCRWIAAEGDLLAGDHDHAGVRGPALHPDRFGRGPGRWPGRAGAAQPDGLAGVERVGSGAQQLAGVEVEEQQRAPSSIRIPTRRPARISAASTTWPPSDTVPARATVRSTSTIAVRPAARPPRGSGGGPAGTAPCGGEAGQVVDAEAASGAS